MQARQALGRIQRPIQEDPINNKAHEERLGHFQSGGQDGEQEKSAYAVTRGTEPAETCPQVFAPPGPSGRWRARGRRRSSRFGRIVEAPLLIIIPKPGVATA